MKQVFDEIRQQWVAATPEEMVRQSWIQRMAKELGFPKELLVVERELKALPHLERHPQPLPTRRIDLLSFAYSDERIFFPLLLVECKVERLSQNVLEQALAYNSFVQARYVAVVNQSHIRLQYQGVEMNRLPSFSELIKVVYG